MADIGYGFQGGPFPNDGTQARPAIVEGVYTFLPATDGTGSINFGNGTTDMDVKVFMGDTLNYALFDVSAGYFGVLRTVAATSAATYGMQIAVNPLAGVGFRQGGLNITVSRAAAETFTWDGNPDCGLKIIAANYAANVVGEGAERAVDLQARNRGTYTSWVNCANLNVRNDSGKTTGTMTGMSLRVEDYGTVSTEAVGLNIELSVEGSSAITSGIVIRSTDASGMAAVKEVFRISHTSTNGFTNLFNFAGATGDCAATGTCTNSNSADVYSDAKITVVFNGNTYYIPLFN